jgi:hypothetical protein
MENETKVRLLPKTKIPKNVKELIRLAQTHFPGSSVEQDEYNQYVIYTDLTSDDWGETLRGVVPGDYGSYEPQSTDTDTPVSKLNPEE